MPLPKPDRNKVRKVAHHKQTELYQGPPYIKEKEKSMDNPGGGGVEDQAWWKKNIREEQQRNIYQFDKRIEQLVKRYNNIRRKGVANHNIVLAPLRDHSKS